MAGCRSGVTLAALCLPGPADPWGDLGFTVADGRIAFANGAIALGAASPAFEIAVGVVSDVGSDVAPDLEGIPLALGEFRPAAVHPNGAVGLDHVVIVTDSLMRTSCSVEQTLGLERRRIREHGSVRQAFHRFGDAGSARGCIIEIVERPDAAGVSVWGVVVIVDDLDRVVTTAGGRVGAPKDAVQPGRQIATVAQSVGLPIAVAMMSR